MFDRAKFINSLDLIAVIVGTYVLGDTTYLSNEFPLLFPPPPPNDVDDIINNKIMRRTMRRHVPTLVLHGRAPKERTKPATGEDRVTSMEGDKINVTTTGLFDSHELDESTPVRTKRDRKDLSSSSSNTNSRTKRQRPQFTFEGRPLKLTETPESLSVYRNNYFQDLSRRMCSGLRRPINLTSDGTEAEFLSSTGDAIFVTQGSSQEQIIREQYTLVTEALRRAKRRGQRTGQIVATDDAWLTVEAAMFRFVEMLSEYVINPAQTMVNSTINS